MEAWELARKLRREINYNQEVWDAGELLVLDINGKPVLETWYIEQKGGEKIHRIYRYVDNIWIETVE